jgi:2-phospho-L-lactate transferase/gluconeogenesis factor (CofD/UPF0052 family)
LVFIFFDKAMGALQAVRAFNRHDVILAVPTNLTVSIGTFSAA